MCTVIPKQWLRYPRWEPLRSTVNASEWNPRKVLGTPQKSRKGKPRSEKEETDKQVERHMETYTWMTALRGSPA